MLTVLLSLLAPVDGRPCPSDLLHFPHPSVCVAEVEKADARLKYLSAAKDFCQQNAVGHEREEARAWRVKWCWICLLDSHNGKHVIRDRLARLREYLGPDDYYEGRMPSLYP